MSTVGERERITQDRVIKLFKEHLHYDYLGNWYKRENNRNVEDGILQSYLKRKGYSDDLINQAIFKFTQAASNQAKSLYDINKEVYTLLRYGVKIRENVGENNQTVDLINWNDPHDNHFAIAEEVTIKGDHKKRPDIVLYINGIALGVLELKRSTVSVSEGIRQNLDNQSSNFIKPFFSTMQFVMAGNDTEGIRYGTIETPEKYYLGWREDEKAGDAISKQVAGLSQKVDYILDKNIISLCHKERFIEMIHNFIIYDRGIKKLCRLNQYFGVRAAVVNVKKREGGIIWHTQGSGKSLTMVWIAKWVRENISNSRILIITDRDELDKQIEKVFKGVDEEIYRTTSGKDLVDKLNDTIPLMLCSLIHKFGVREEKGYDEYIEQLKKHLPKDFKAKGDIYVFVDECHRTQSGKLNEAMKSILPNALFIGFTGTPLLKKDKVKSVEIFGGYIHTYKFDEAVSDNVVLDLRYEARDVDQDITSQERIDRWFEAKTRGLTDYAKSKLKKRWGTMQRVLSSKSRLEQIVKDIILDMGTKDRLQNGRGNAMLIASSIYEACKYYEFFQAAGFKKCAVVSSYVPNINDIKGESTGEGTPTENITKYEIYQRMLNGKNADVFEDEVKKKFIEEPAQLKLIIVVDKLLTGFDAPPATYLYIDKNMQDHGLFQAICRVNRLDGDDKEYGYIIDYKDLFKSLERSITDYTSGAFDDYDDDDVKGILSNRLQKAKEKLDNSLESIKALCEPVAPPKDTLAYIRYFCAQNTGDKNALKDNQHNRVALYKFTSSLVRAYSNIANEMIEAGYDIKEAKSIKQDVHHFNTVKEEVMLASSDYIDLKQYEPAMRHLIDNYISAAESEKISDFDDMTIIDLIVDRGSEFVKELPENIKKNKEAVAETIENNVRRLITDEMPTDPKYFKDMSMLLDEIIRRRKEEVTSYEEYLKEIIDAARKAKNPYTATSYPTTINTALKKTLYNNLNNDEDLVLHVDKDITNTKPDGWKGNRLKERAVFYAIKRHIDDDETAEKIFEIVKNQGDN